MSGLRFAKLICQMSIREMISKLKTLEYDMNARWRDEWIES
jgi:hypothetical protein